MLYCIRNPSSYIVSQPFIVCNYAESEGESTLLSMREVLTREKG